MVVEDIALNQLLMKTLLDDYGFECDLAGNGIMAIEKLKNKPYDIVLMDLQMPEMNGFEATRYIREKMESDIPIIALTADVTTTDLKKCKSVGMNDYISKPVDEKLLYNKIIDLIIKPELSVNIVGSSLIKGKPKYTDLTYLMGRTKANPQMMLDMITLYLEQTPVLINAMKKSLLEKDWDSLYAAVHKIIPSFYIMGIHKDYENTGKKIQEYASTHQHLDEIQELVIQLDNICSEACEELKVICTVIKKTIEDEHKKNTAFSC